VIAIVAIVTVVLARGGDKALEVETADAQVRAITQSVTASGKIRPEIEVPISSEVSGEIVFLGVEEGDRVQEGQLLLRIRGEFYTAQREQAQAGLLQSRADAARARAEYLRAEADLARQQSLFDRGVVPEAEIEAAQTRFQVAQASLEAAEYRIRSAEASLSQAADQLRRTAIHAPMTGTVSMLNVELGQRVVGTAQMIGTEIMRIAELDQMELEVDINENDVVNVSLGDSARVEVDAYPDRPLYGIVTRIANSARVTGAGTQDQVTSFPVKIKLNGTAARLAGGADLAVTAADEAGPRPGPLLRPGMSGTVDIYTQTIERAVVVPIQAVTVRDFNRLLEQEDAETPRDAFVPEDLRRVVFVVRDGIAHMVEVSTSISDDTHIAVESGITGGDTVITGPFRLLRTEIQDGDAVRIREEPARRGPNSRS
jgi:HlyD family secretion protein